MKCAILHVFILLSSVSIISCSTELAPEAYIAWIKNPGNGFRHVSSANGFHFDLQYKPLELIWLEQGGSKAIPLEKVKKKFGDLQYIELSIRPENGQASILQVDASTTQKLQQNLYYYSYLFEHDISLEIDGERFPCTLFHFERSVDIKPDRVFSLGFEAPIPKNGLATLIIRSERLSALPIRLQINFSQIPMLKV
ncbi:MAG: hypothetical protein KF846_13745 [Cyclobacteriaceae bacterium]|nr:hypothetical protein [Cyclobacteriaceae bacterium]MBX2957221.1 hypothetical protein [Cyclobacteriaceae bacterium]